MSKHQKNSRQKKRINRSLIKFVKVLFLLFEIIRFPKHFSKFSNKIFDNHQLVILLVLKQKLRTTYRGLIEILKVAETLRLAIGLNRIPHHTTLVKFAKKIKTKLLNLLLPHRKAEMTGLDGTGFEIENRSMHYQIRTARSTYRRYIKLSISADLDKQIILKHEINKSPRHDSKDFMSCIKDIKTSFVCADKAYDSNENHRFIIQDLNAKSLIAIKNYGIKRKSWKKNWRKHALKLFDEKLYHQRSKIESIFSSIKRKYGSCLRARTFSTQEKEIIFKLITYNLDRKIKSILRGFQQSQLIDKFLY